MAKSAMIFRPSSRVTVRLMRLSGLPSAVAKRAVPVERVADFLRVTSQKDQL